MPGREPSRRRVLRLLGAGLLGGLAGCTDTDGTVGTAANNGTATNGTATSPSATGTGPVQTGKFTGNDSAKEDLFGVSVTISDDDATALVGATGDDPHGSASGSAYVFEHSGGAWVQQAKLTTGTRSVYSNFGCSVALSRDGTTALVGASEDANYNGDRAGAAYAFERGSGGWSQDGVLTPSDGDQEDEFGSDVALSDDGKTAVVGASQDEDPNGKEAGSAYVFERGGGAWPQQAKLDPTSNPPDIDRSDQFGVSVGLSGDGKTAVVGAYRDNTPKGVSSGAAYVFEQSGGSWSQRTRLVGKATKGYENLGWSVSLSRDGTTALLGAPWRDDPNSSATLLGAAYLFELSGGSWNEQAMLVASDRDADDEFGHAVALAADGSSALVGARSDEDPNGTEAGSAYLFEPSGGSWSETAKLAPSDGDTEDRYGYSVALGGTGTRALVGARNDEDPTGSFGGAVYSYDL